MSFLEIGNPIFDIIVTLFTTILFLLVYFRITVDSGEKLKIILNILVSLVILMRFNFFWETIWYLQLLHWWLAELPFFGYFIGAKGEIYYFWGILLGIVFLAWVFINLAEWANELYKWKRHIINYTILWMTMITIGIFLILPERNNLSSYTIIPDMSVTIRWKQLFFSSPQFKDSEIPVDFRYNVTAIYPWDNESDWIFKSWWIEDRIISFAYFYEQDQKEWKIYDRKARAKENILWISPYLTEAIEMQNVLVSKKYLEKRNKLLEDGISLYKKCFDSDEEYLRCFKEDINPNYDFVIKELIKMYEKVEIDLWELGKYDLWK